MNCKPSVQEFPSFNLGPSSTQPQGESGAIPEDGLAATETIRQIEGRCERVPIIAITAYDTYGMKDAALAAGCNDYLRKPIDEKEFERVLERIFPF